MFFPCGYFGGNLFKGAHWTGQEVTAVCSVLQWNIILAICHILVHFSFGGWSG